MGTPPVQPSRRLIQDQNSRPHGIYGCDADLAPQAKAQNSGLEFGIGGQVEILQSLFRTLLHLRFFEANIAGAEGYFLACCRAEYLVIRVLENISYSSRQVGHWVLAIVFTVEQHPTAGRAEQSVEMFCQRSFTRTILSNEGDEIAPLNLERDALQHRWALLIGEPQVRRFETHITDFVS